MFGNYPEALEEKDINQGDEKQEKPHKFKDNNTNWDAMEDAGQMDWTQE